MKGGINMAAVALCVTILVVASLAAVVTVLLVASSQAAILVGVIATVVVPTTTAFFAYLKGQATEQTVQSSHDSIVETINKSGS